MQTESSEREDIAKLFRDAFVRVCQLALADCGVSVAELTLHLSIQLNTAVPQILGTIVAETVRSPLAKDSSVTSGIEALNEDNNNVDCHSDTKESFTNDRSLDSSVNVDDVDIADFNGTVAVGSSAAPCTNENAFTAAKDSQVASCTLDVNSVENLILSEDSREVVPLEELLADVGKSGECSVSGSPAALAECGEDTFEAGVMLESSRASLSNISSSETGSADTNGACWSKLHNSDVPARCMIANCTAEAGQSGASNTSFLQCCHYRKQDSSSSNSACIAAESALSAGDGTEIEVDGLSVSQHSLLYRDGKTSDRSAVEGDTSYEDELIVDESCSCSDTHACHTVAAESLTTNLCSPLNRQPVYTESPFVSDVLLLKPYAGDCLLSSLCPDMSEASYSQQPSLLAVGSNRYRLVSTNGVNNARETEFQKILSSMSTNVAAVPDADRGMYLHRVIYLLIIFALKFQYTLYKQNLSRYLYQLSKFLQFLEHNYRPPEMV